MEKDIQKTLLEKADDELSDKTSVKEDKHQHGHSQKNNNYKMNDLLSTLKEAFDLIKIIFLIGFIAVMWVWTAMDRRHEYATIHQLASNGHINFTFYQDTNQGTTPLDDRNQECSEEWQEIFAE